MSQPFQFTRGAGGKFTGSVGGVPIPPAMAAAIQRLGAAAGGPMSFNGRTGTGYNSRNGDPRVKLLQQALNAAGFTDGQGRPLAVDGKLGPLTTAALKAAQKQLGVPTDGVATPKLLAQIMSLPPRKSKPVSKPSMKAAPVKRAPNRTAAALLAAAKTSPAAPQSLQRGRVKFQ
jgi:peptidoglycan hydrolase-like protein with peptidoglycan-binding domain